MNTHRAWIATLAMAPMLLAGCYKATFYTNPNVVRGQEHDEWTDFFIYGLAGTERFDVHEFCGDDEVAEVKTGGNFGTGLVSFITLGIYTPRKVYVTCAAPSGAETYARRLELDLDGSGHPVQATLSNGEVTAVAQVTPASDEAYAVRVQGVKP